ncbi:MAG: hypothetical protein WBB99_01470 [Rhodococcus sp. (in: high G+C Gram-positive bacteria)]
MESFPDLLLRASAALSTIYAFYVAAATKWPTSYYLLDDVVGPRVAKTTWSYGLFRFAPLFVATLCATGYLPDTSSRLIVAALIVIGHLAISVLRINPYTNPGPKREKSWYALQVAILASSIVVAAVAAMLVQYTGDALPQWRDLVSAAVTAVVVISLSAALQNTTGSSNTINEAAIDRAEKKYERTVSRIAVRNKVNRRFLLALVIAEDLQRPSWFRVIERRLARAGLARTVGLGQSASDWFVTDEQGIDRLAASIGQLTVNGTLSRARLAASAELCNEGDGYVEFVLHIYDHLQARQAETSFIDEDGNPLIISKPPALYHGEWLITGDIGPSINWLTVRNHATDDSMQIAILEESNGRRPWRAQVPIDWTEPEIYSDIGSPNAYDTRLNLYALTF